MTKNTISVIIPVYNTELYLPRCLDSVINSDYDDLEIICVNDGSTDQSLSILREYQKKNNRVKVIDIPNGGVSNARNVGLDNSTGEFIAFIDSDDWIHPRLFGILADNMKQYDADIIACDFLQCDKPELEQTVIPDEVMVKQFEKDNLQMRKKLMAYIWGKLYRAELLENVRFDTSVSVCEDLVFSIDVLNQSEKNKLAFVDSKLYYYFTREDSASNSCDQIERANAGNALLKRAEAADSKELQGVYLDEAFRLLIKARYEILKTSDNEQLASVNEMLNNWLLTEKALAPIESKKAFTYRTFAKHPRIYKMYRKTTRIIRKARR